MFKHKKKFLRNFFHNLSPFFLLTPTERSIGNAGEEIFYGNMHARRFGKKLLILRRLRIFGNPEFSNLELMDLQSPYSVNNPVLRWLGNFFLSVSVGHLPVLATWFWKNFKNAITFHFKYQRLKYLYNPLIIGQERLWNPRLKEEFSWEESDRIDWYSDFMFDYQINISANKKKKCEDLVQEMGLSKAPWYVCLHVREGGYYKDFDAARNSKVENTIEAIKAITAAGGWVVRMGDSTMTPLPPMPQVIDYPFTKFKSAVMDLYLLKNCALFLGTNSGIYDNALMFQRPVVAVNVTERIFSPATTKYSLMISKHVFSKKHGRFLSIKELMNEPYSSHDFDHLDKRNYTFVENTPDEIRDVVLEALGQRSLGDKYQHSSLQLEFIRKRREQNARYIASEKFYDDPAWDLHRKYRIAAKTTYAQGTIGKIFLEKNWERNSLNKNHEKMPTL